MEDGLVPWFGMLPRCFSIPFREASAAFESLVSPFGGNMDVYHYAALGFIIPVVDAACPSPFFILIFLI